MSEMKETNVTVSQSASRRMITDFKRVLRGISRNVEDYSEEVLRVFQGYIRNI